MKPIETTDMVRSAILGTLVSDASGMGLHWIYSQGKIAKIVQDNGDVAEFLQPDETNYSGVPAFFAHPRKQAGDGSNYGEYLYVLLQAISQDGFDRAGYIRAFAEHFGVGGPYVGYADGPMRETIYNITRTQKEINSVVMQTQSPLSEERKKQAAHYIARYFFEHDSDGLKETIRAPLKLQQWSADELRSADSLIDRVSSALIEIGADDDQMPALTRSAVLAHFYAGDELDQTVENAVRVTNNNDDAVAYSVFMARTMRDLYEAGRPARSGAAATLRELVERHIGVLGDHAQELIKQALGMSELDYRGATKTFGAACHVDMAVPLVLHILLNSGSYAEANRANIMAGGDNCGRAVMLGSLAGAMYGIGGDAGVPQEWIDRTTTVIRVRETPGGQLLL